MLCFQIVLADATRGVCCESMSKVSYRICTAKQLRRSPCSSRLRLGHCNDFSNRSSGMKRSSKIDASRSSPKNMPTARPLVAWTSPERPRAVRRRWVQVVSGMAAVGRWTTVWWGFISATRHPTFKCCWIARSTFRKVGPTTQRAEKHLYSGRNRVPHKTADRVGADRWRSGQRRDRVSLDVRRVIRPRWQVSRWVGIAWSGVRGRDTDGLSWLGGKAKGAAKWPENR